MDELYEQYRDLNLDGRWIGLELAEGPSYFCTPLGAKVLGWDGGIHYCVVEGLGNTVFCVDPETCCDRYVYPIARDFREFLSLILAAGHTNPLQQIICWDKETFEAFLRRPEERAQTARPEVQLILTSIRQKLGVAPATDPFGAVKNLQSGFPYDQIPFSNEYYDMLGLPHPNGSEPAEPCFSFTPVEFRFEKK